MGEGSKASGDDVGGEGIDNRLEPRKTSSGDKLSFSKAQYVAWLQWVGSRPRFFGSTTVTSHLHFARKLDVKARDAAVFSAGEEFSVVLGRSP